ncbi:MAG: class B sortase [Oscillospiraceae bacterium]
MVKWTKRTKTIVVIALAALLLFCAFAVVWVLSGANGRVERFSEAAPKAGESPKSSDSGGGQGTKAAGNAYQSPVDFQALQKANPDIYAWLDIPGTDISYPLLRREGDDAFYMTHDGEGKRNESGALFTETKYNNGSFSDPVTIVYGHYMRNGLLFGRLQEYYSDPKQFEAYKKMVIYLPDRGLHFEAFAAVPYDSRHILYSYDFTDKRTFRLFFDSILSVRAMEAMVPADAAVQWDEQVLILSTCLIGDRTNRFLVCAKQVEHS